MGILKESIEINNQVIDRLGALDSDEPLSYEDADTMYNDVRNMVADMARLDQDFIENGQEQIDAFQPILSFALGKNKNNQISEIRKSLEMGLDNSVVSQKNNSENATAFLPLIKITANMMAFVESSKVENASDALVAASPLKGYTVEGFSYEDESLIKDSSPSTYDALQNSKKLFTDYYNLLLATNSGNQQEAYNIAIGLSDTADVAMASMENAFSEDNPLAESWYQSEIEVIEIYIIALEDLGISYNQNRENAWYTIQSIEYYNRRQDEAPKAADYEALKQLLSLEYGSTDTLKYSTVDYGGYYIEYLKNGSWVKIEIKY